MIVIDASVWVSFFVQQDVNHTVTQPWLTQILTNKTSIVAPLLLLAEIGGAMARRTNNPEIGDKVIDQLLSIPTLRLVSSDHALGIQAGRIAATYRLRGADAIYVAVANQFDIPLVSWDKEHIKRVSDLIAVYTPTKA